MISSSQSSWGPRPTAIQRSRPEPPRPRRSRRWILWVSMALLGAILAAVVAPMILKRKGTPDRLASPENVRPAVAPVDPETYSSEHVRAQFRKPEKPESEEEEIAPRTGDGRLMY